ncbi:MAG: hypothetical protein M3220_18915 [Chloroflexota bacterium]|nr:hypothetical protein [Chloroflexota bacterium]
MPRLSVWMIRSSFLHLALGILLGSAILWQKGPGGLPAAWGWLPFHIHLVLVGWMIQLALGVAYWILPRFTYRNEHERVAQRRGREGLAWASFLLLNVSTLLALTSRLGWLWSPRVSGLLVALAGAAFAIHLWPRVKPFMA